MPGRIEPWSRFLRDAEAARLDRVVCLAPLLEVQRLSPDYFAAIQARQLPCRWMHLPMRDFGVPDNLLEFKSAVVDLCAALRAGESMVLHCAAGIGRTGTTAACLLKGLGLSTAQALKQVREAGSNPETAAQSGLIDSL